MDYDFYLKGSEIGRGAYKTVYKAIDRRKGIEVAWNELDINKELLEIEKVKQEVDILRTLSNDNVIRFYEYWIDDINFKMVFITELMTSGSLRNFLQTAKFVSLQAVKDWCRQILNGLDYLHNLEPPIIHRDIKLDNIFFHGAKGRVKIGDLGLATILHQKNVPMSIIGTPEFMAPEFYNETYDEKVDIWAFGLCVIEMTTLDYPYNECSNVGSIYKTVSSGLKPQALAKIKDPEILEFLCSCLEEDVAKRLDTGQLLSHPFLEIKESDENYVNHHLRSEQELAEAFKIIGTPPTKQGWEIWIEKEIGPIRYTREQQKLKMEGIDFISEVVIESPLRSSLEDQGETTKESNHNFYDEDDVIIWDTAHPSDNLNITHQITTKRSPDLSEEDVILDPKGIISPINSVSLSKNPEIRVSRKRDRSSSVEVNCGSLSNKSFLQPSVNSVGSSPRNTESLPSPLNSPRKEALPHTSFSQTSTPVKEESKNSKLENQMSKNLLELTFTMSSSKKAEWPASDWFIDPNSRTTIHSLNDPNSSPVSIIKSSSPSLTSSSTGVMTSSGGGVIRPSSPGVISSAGVSPPIVNNPFLDNNNVTQLVLPPHNNNTNPFLDNNNTLIQSPRQTEMSGNMPSTQGMPFQT